VAVQEPSSRAYLAGQFFKHYRKLHNLTQEQFAHDLGMEPRALRAYENAERPLRDVDELQRIADLLGVEPERFGLTSTPPFSRTARQIDEVIEHAWSLLRAARYIEARTVSEHLIRSLRFQINNEDPALLDCLARAYHVAGHAASQNSKISELSAAIQQYETMESVARLTNDHSLLNIALTYQGDMFRRRGDLGKAIICLEAARDSTPLADAASRGNSIQLLGRAYLQIGNLHDFEHTMAEAEKIAATIEPDRASTHGQYSVGAVLEEYGRGYGSLGQMQRALDYVDRAEASLPPTIPWKICLTATRAMALVRGGEYRQGVQLAEVAADLCQTHKNFRLLERVYGILHHVEKLRRELGQLSAPLREKLDGPIIEF